MVETVTSSSILSFRNEILHVTIFMYNVTRDNDSRKKVKSYGRPD